MAGIDVRCAGRPAVIREVESSRWYDTSVPCGWAIRLDSVTDDDLSAPCPACGGQVEPITTPAAATPEPGTGERSSASAPAAPEPPPLDLAPIRQRHQAATPGPWYWRGHRRGPIWLAPNTMRLPTVMGFRRLGLWDAQPTFVVDGAFTPASELAVREVPYRDDIIDIDHPDARFLASAWADERDLLRGRPPATGGGGRSGATGSADAGRVVGRPRSGPA